MPLLDLPVDIFLDSLLPRLDTSSLARLSETCRYLKQLCNDDRLWRERVEADYPRSIGQGGCGYKALYRRLKDVKIYTWGENSDKRLGFNDQDNVDRDTFMRQITTPRELRSLGGKGIVDIVAGGWSFHALDRNGRVWMWGWMQPKHPFAREGPVNHSLVRNPTLVRLPPDVHIQSIASGRSHAIALDQNGSVWHWANCWQPNRVHISKTKARVKQVTASWNHSIILTTAGELYRVPFPGIRPITIDDQPVTIQHTQHSSAVSHHQYVSVHPCDRFVQIAGMEKWTLVISRFGRVFKLKTDKRDWFSTDPASLFVELSEFKCTQSPIIGISAQSRHFAVCTASKVLLGSQDDAPDSKPTVMSIQGHEIYKITFGDWHFGALTKQGKLLTWGRYSSGALGHGFDYNEVGQDCPQIVEALDGMFIISAGFGGYHSGCIAFPLH